MSDGNQVTHFPANDQIGHCFPEVRKKTTGQVYFFDYEETYTNRESFRFSSLIKLRCCQLEFRVGSQNHRYPGADRCSLIGLGFNTDGAIGDSTPDQLYIPNLCAQVAIDSRSFAMRRTHSTLMGELGIDGKLRRYQCRLDAERSTRRNFVCDLNFCFQRLLCHLWCWCNLLHFPDPICGSEGSLERLRHSNPPSSSYLGPPVS